MKKIILFTVMCLMCITSVFADNNKRRTDFDKNTKKVESKKYEYSTSNYDCNITFWVLIDDETSHKSSFVCFTFFSKSREGIEVNGDMVVGTAGNPVKIIELYQVKRSMSENYYKLSAYYPIDDMDIDEFFNCNKIRVQTKMSNIDMTFRSSELKTMKKNYDAVLEEANRIYNINTNITYGF